MLWGWSIILMTCTWRPLNGRTSLNCNNRYMLSIVACCYRYNLALLLWWRVISRASIPSSEVPIDYHLMLAWVDHLWSAAHWSVGFGIQTVATHWPIHPCQISCWIISLTVHCLLSWVIKDSNLVLSHRTHWSFKIYIMIKCLQDLKSSS